VGKRRNLSGLRSSERSEVRPTLLGASGSLSGVLDPANVRPEDPSAYIFESQPGDVLAFNLACWHASFGGSDFRRQGVVIYYEDSHDPEIEPILRERIIRGKGNAARLGQSQWFTPYWRSIDNPHHQRWVRRLDQLGVLD